MTGNGKIQGKITFGIDGFVDEVWQVLANRFSRTDYLLFDKMRDFAKSVYDCGEGGYANEIIRKRRSYGGFVANTGKTAGRLGADVSMLGMFGADSIDPVFKGFVDEFKVISVADPAVCQIFEFTDGKLMLPFIEGAMDYSWEKLRRVPGLEEAMDADIVAIGYWSQLHEFDDIVTKLCENFLIKGRCQRMFFDFADIRKRDQGSLERTLQVLAGLDMPMTLSLNEHEGGLLFSYLGRNFDWEDSSKAEDHIEYVRKETGLDELIIHTPYFAVAATAREGVATVMQEYCKNPVITTGAGDNFNGGYLAACLDKRGLTERLAVGNAVTGFYVRNGYSPSQDDLRSR